jgi:hypothetical protein
MMGKGVTNMMIWSPWVTDAWPVLRGGFSLPGPGSYDSQKGFDFTADISSQYGLE